MEDAPHGYQLDFDYLPDSERCDHDAHRFCPWSRSQVRKAVDAAVPALLGALISLVSKPQGAAKLYDL